MNPLHESWQQGWNVVGWTMLYFLAAGTVVLLLGGVLRVLLRRATPNIRYATSLATFAALALLPLVIAPQIPAPELTTKITKDTKVEFTPQASRGVPAPGWAPDVKASRQRKRPEPLASQRILPAQVIAPTLESSFARAVEYLPWLWLVGSPLTFLLLAAGVVGTERLRRSSQLLTAGPIHQACAELRVALGVGRQVGVAICESVATPLLVGIVRPLVLLPAAALGWPADQLEMVLLHELAHVRRWDNAVNLAQRIVESLLFFHPAIWITSTWVRRDREECCDAVVVGQTAKPQAYAELLLALASPPPLAGLASSALTQHPVAIRIRRILKLEDESMLVSRNTFTLVVSGALALVLVAGFLLPSDAEEPSTKGTKVKTTDASRGVPAPGALASRQRQRPEETTKGTNNTKEEIAEGEKSNPMFPTLEEQKTADFAYKLLGIELEKLSPKELQVVKEKGYAGGLRITSGVFGQNFPNQLLEDDLLVGLHVWSTESLDQVREILTRFDIHELTPLKFYVLREVPPGSGSIKVFTGRTHVNLDAWASREGFKKKRLEQAREEAVEDSSADELRYDGKTIDFWKNIFSSELKFEPRVTAMNALVEFGKEGKGTEVAKIFLELAAKYDSEDLASQELDLLGSMLSLPSEVLLNAIFDAADSENPHLRDFARRLAEDFATRSPEIEAKLKEKFPDLKAMSHRGGF